MDSERLAYASIVILARNECMLIERPQLAIIPIIPPTPRQIMPYGRRPPSDSLQFYGLVQRETIQPHTRRIIKVGWGSISKLPLPANNRIEGHPNLLRGLLHAYPTIVKQQQQLIVVVVVVPLPFIH